VRHGHPGMMVLSSDRRTHHREKGYRTPFGSEGRDFSKLWTKFPVAAVNHWPASRLCKQGQVEVSRWLSWVGGWHSLGVVTAAFVISDQPSHITGQIWWVNGGAVMR